MSTQRTSMSGQSGKFLTTDGQTESWAVLPSSTTANNGTSLNGTVVELGNIAGGTSSTLLSNREIPTGGFNLSLSGTGKFGIGRSANQQPQALLHVGTGNTTGVVGSNVTILGTPNATADIGNFSVHTGETNRVVGNWAMATGKSNSIYSSYSFISGTGNTIGTSGQVPDSANFCSFASGYGNTITKDCAFASGNGCQVSGSNSLAFGGGANVSSLSSLGGGTNTTVSGTASVGIGDGANVSGNVSQGFGYGTIAQGMCQLAVGFWNLGQGANRAAPLASDYVFIAGNGTSTTRKNALAVQFDGTIQINNQTGAGVPPNPTNPTMGAITMKNNIYYAWDVTLAVWKTITLV